MKLADSVRNLALASMLAMSVIAVPAVQVHAADKGGDEGIVMDCLNQGTGEWTQSGQVDYVRDGKETMHVLGCDDGKWVDLGTTQAMTTNPQPMQPVHSRPIGRLLGS